MTSPADPDQLVEVGGFRPTVAAQVREVAEHLNENHGDSVALLGWLGGGRPDFVDAEIMIVTPERLTIQPYGPLVGPRHLAFELGGVSSVDELRAAMFGLMSQARAAAGERAPTTSIEHEMAATATLPTFVTTVSAASMVAPHIRQLTVTGGLDGFRSLGRDQFVYLMIPRAGHADVIGDGCTMAAMQQLPEERRPAGAYYTVRAWRPERGELDLWFVLHASEGAVSSWAAQAGAGDRLALWGPRLGYEPPPGTTSQLLLADETGLAAVAAILAEIDQATAVRVLAETVDADHAISFPERPNVEIDWLYRGDDEPGTGNRFLDAVEKLPLEPEGLYAFGGAESRQLTAIRSYLRRELGLDREQVHLTGYWRRSIET